MNGVPRVTAVVPTRGLRPALLQRAVESVWRQEGVVTDVVIVFDGPAAAELGPEITDHPSLEVVYLPEQRGQRHALDAGVARARAPWVAFLDDDDEWHDPTKLLQQLTIASTRPGPTVVSSRVLIEINGRFDRIAPSKPWQPGTDLGEFAFCIDRRFEVGLVQQSTLFMATAFARAHPFAAHLDPHPDIGLALECVAAGAEFVQLPDALSTWRIDDDREQMSTSRSWRQTLAWCDRNAALLSPRAYAGALLTAGARSVDSRRGMPAIWRRACQGGSPRVSDLLASLYLAYVPRRIRRRIHRGKRIPGSAEE